MRKFSRIIGVVVFGLGLALATGGCTQSPTTAEKDKMNTSDKMGGGKDKMSGDKMSGDKMGGKDKMDGGKMDEKK